ncbi:hypothetical protein K443DRAFT_170109 [Laccaria amethystina LaAM-08-1]|uniref:F-box domain-containing protein n=1 Tax=Laccaria amethystina LaAM-08-1 TaxID=1095629 RepID=A0A0C9XRR2_9AGAR|nr:hypothetical protein K443DRAFT_170109 [Laccaria amethystina LaAM-08-1]
MPRPQFFPRLDDSSRRSSVSRVVSHGLSQNAQDTVRGQNAFIPDFARRSALILPRRTSFADQGLFDRLPVELHVEIFSHCLSPFPTLSVKEAPLLIALVCKAWKELVYNTPRFWSSFEIEIRGSPSGTSVEDLRLSRLMKIWLQRSGSRYALSVRVVHDPLGRVDDVRSAPLLLELIKHARRWRHVEFVVPSASLAVLQNTLPEDFPILRSLTLQMKGLWNSTAGLDIRTTGIPWAQLTALDLQVESHILTLDECLELLTKAVNLTSCTLNAECVLSSPAPDRQSLRLPRLTSLHLILQGGMSALAEEPEASLTSFLNYFTGMELESFHVEWLVRSRSWSGAHPAFVSFLHGLSPSLRSLNFAYLPLDEAELMECLAQLPYLTEMDLRFSLGDRVNDPITDGLLQYYTLPSSNTPLSPSSLPSFNPSLSLTSLLSLDKKKKQPRVDSPVLEPPLIFPALERLYLQCNGESCTNAALLALIQSRWNPNARRDISLAKSLKYVRFVSMKPADWDVQIQVKQWKEEGLDIMIDSLHIR